MSTKTLTITEEAYERLFSKKRDKESFSDVINRITNKGSILAFAGVLTKEEGKALEKEIASSRAQSRKRTERTLYDS